MRDSGDGKEGEQARDWGRAAESKPEEDPDLACQSRGPTNQNQDDETSEQGERLSLVPLDSPSNQKKEGGRTGARDD